MHANFAILFKNSVDRQMITLVKTWFRCLASWKPKFRFLTEYMFHCSYLESLANVATCMRCGFSLRKPASAHMAAEGLTPVCAVHGLLRRGFILATMCILPSQTEQLWKCVVQKQPGVAANSVCGGGEM